MVAIGHTEGATSALLWLAAGILLGVVAPTITGEVFGETSGGITIRISHPTDACKCMQQA